MPINKNEITKEMLEKAMQCETAEELMALVKSEGFEISKDEAEAYLAELDDMELDEKTLRNVAGGTCITEGTSCWTLSN
jgi:predicted ribosomally synthesized peptide with nif11-like leader